MVLRNTPSPLKRETRLRRTFFNRKNEFKSNFTEKLWCETEIKDANVAVRTCPNCGAGRAKQDGLTKCAYCDFQFHDGELTDGIYIKKDDNSK